MRAPIRPLSGRWPSSIEARAGRFFWIDPTVILDDNVDPDIFRSAMSALHVGDTIKITGSNRHPLSDALLIDNVKLEGARIVDIGASDGSTSVDLIKKLPTFGAYVIADLYLHLETIKLGRHMFLYDHSGECVLVVGPRVVAWPTQSRWVYRLYRPLIARASRHGQQGPRILLLNPAARAIVAADPRVSYTTHDAFTVWPGQQPDVIKVANLLRRLYFSDEMIAQAVGALLSSLGEGGHLLMVDNPRIAGIAERGGLYRRSGQQFVAIARTPETPEIDDLILKARLNE
jgi:hypothetical protein